MQVWSSASKRVLSERSLWTHFVTDLKTQIAKIKQALLTENGDRRSLRLLSSARTKRRPSTNHLVHSPWSIAGRRLGRIAFLGLRQRAQEY